MCGVHIGLPGTLFPGNLEGRRLCLDFSIPVFVIMPAFLYMVPSGESVLEARMLSRPLLVWHSHLTTEKEAHLYRAGGTTTRCSNPGKVLTIALPTCCCLRSTVAGGSVCRAGAGEMPQDHAGLLKSKGRKEGFKVTSYRSVWVLFPCLFQFSKDYLVLEGFTASFHRFTVIQP